MNTFSLEGKIMVITGGTNGIGRGRLGSIEDIGSAVHYLASDNADMASGHVLVIDGGWTIV